MYSATYYYESRLDHDELVLIADFGGGTRDFTLVYVGPGARKSPRSERVLGTGGVGIAGDALDAKILHHPGGALLGAEIPLSFDVRQRAADACLDLYEAETLARAAS